MNNVMKKLHLTAAAAIGVFCISMTSFAGQWRSDANGWWWQNDDGSYPTFCWQWIDGNDDGIAVQARTTAPAPPAQMTTAQVPQTPTAQEWMTQIPSVQTRIPTAQE